MNLETLDQLPDGKTILPAQLVISKFGKAMSLDIHVTVPKEEQDFFNNAIIEQSKTPVQSK